MSKQRVSSPAPGTRPSAQGKRPQASNTKQQYSQNARPNAATNARGGTTQAGAQRRTGATARTQVNRKTGFRLRPLDMALILGGIIVVAIIVMSALSAPTQAIDPNAQLGSNNVKPAVGQAAPDFSLPDSEGTVHTLSEQKGKVVLLEFMATWCPHCQNEAPMYERIRQKYAGQPVEIWGVNATPQNHTRTGQATIDDLKWFRTTYSTEVPLLFDKTLASANAYAITGYPQIYVIDKQGNVAVQPSDTSLYTEEQITGFIDEQLKK